MKTWIVLLITALVVSSSSIKKSNRNRHNNNNRSGNNNNNNNNENDNNGGIQSSSSSSSESSSEERKINNNNLANHLYRGNQHQKMMPQWDLNSLAEVQAYGLMEAFLAPNITKQSEDEGHSRQQHSSIDQNLPRSGSSNNDVFDPKLFAKRAVQFWVQKEFLKYYRKYSLTLTSSEIQSAQQTYNKFKLESYQSKGKAGVIVNLDTDKLKGVVDLWQKSDLVSINDAQQMKYLIDAEQGMQVDGDYVLKRNDGTLVFARFAFINTATKSSGIQTGSIVYMFHSYQFKVTLDVKTTRTSVCFLWGLICASRVTVTSQPLSGEETTNMANFMKIQASRDYDENIGSYLQYLNKEAKRYERFQPAEFKDDWSKIDAKVAADPETDPTTVLPNKNALDPKNYQV